MKITHIGHCGFMVEFAQEILIFDYYRGEIPPLDWKKQVYFFSSHVHADHFNMHIFSVQPDEQAVSAPVR